MKKLFALMIAVLLVFAVGCGAQTASPELESQTPALSSESPSEPEEPYSDIVTACQKAMSESMSRLNNVFMYEFSYLEAGDKIGGLSTSSEEILNKALDRYGYEISDITEQYDEVCEICNEAVFKEVSGSDERLQNVLFDMYQGYIGFYSAIIAPATSSSSYAVSIADSQTAVSDNNDVLNSLLGNSFSVDDREDFTE